MNRAWLIPIFALAAIAALYWSQRSNGDEHVSGIVEAEIVRVGSLVGGRVSEVRVREGQRVARGDVLIALEPYDLQERLAQAEATLAAASATRDRLMAGFRKEEVERVRAERDRAKATLDMRIAGPRPLEIQRLQEQLDIASAELAKASSDFERVKGLYDQGSGAQDEMTRVTRDVAKARAAEAAARSDLALAREGTRVEEVAEARARLGETEANLRMLESGYRVEDQREASAHVAAAEAAVGAIRRQVAETQVSAPLEGVVEAVDLHPGDLIGPNAPVVTLLDLSQMYIRAYVPENRLDLAPGARVELTADAFQGRRFAAEVVFVARTAEFTPSNAQTPEERVKQVFRIKVRPLEGMDVLRPGMAADVHLGARR